MMPHARNTKFLYFKYLKRVAMENVCVSNKLNMYRQFKTRWLKI